MRAIEFAEGSKVMSGGWGILPSRTDVEVWLVRGEPGASISECDKVLEHSTKCCTEGHGKKATEYPA